MLIRRNIFSNLYIIIIIVGFLLTSILPPILGLSDVSFSIQYRIIVLVFALLIIVLGLLVKPIHFYGNIVLLFLFFWCIYSIRFFYDLFILENEIELGKTRSEYLSLAYGISFIPSFALLFLNISSINLRLTFKWIYIILFSMLFTALILRNNSEFYGRSTGDMVIGILFYGQYGTSLSLLSMFLLNKSTSKFNSLFYFFGLILGITTIVISSSRSPFLVLVIVSFIYFIIHTKSFKTAIGIFILLIGFSIYFFEIMDLINQIFPNVFVERLLQAFENVETIGGRSELLSDGVLEFTNQPFLGNAFTLQSGYGAGFYPHNLIIEAFMSTGIVGGMIFVLWISQSVYCSIKMIVKNGKETWIGLLFIQFFLFGMFSGNLYTSDLFWFLSVLVVLIYNLYSIQNLDLINDGIELEN